MGLAFCHFHSYGNVVFKETVLGFTDKLYFFVLEFIKNLSLYLLHVLHFFRFSLWLFFSHIELIVKFLYFIIILIMKVFKMIASEN